MMFLDLQPVVLEPHVDLICLQNLWFRPGLVLSIPI